MTRHEIRVADQDRPCRKTKCQRLTRYRAAYVYQHGAGSVLVPYCRDHLDRFCTAHNLQLPREAA
jgi:hypothetical protein